MKLKFSYLVLLGLLVPLIFIACKTAPVTPPDSLTDGGVSGDSSLSGDDSALSGDQAVLDAAKAGAEASRARAMEVQGQVYFPDEWAEAESRFEENLAVSPAAGKETEDSAAEWDSLAAVYDDIFQNSLSRFAADKKNDLDQVREAALESGARDIIPDRFGQADEFADTAGEQFDQGDYRTAIDSANDAYDHYMVLKTIADAYNKQQEADARDFFAYDPENYELAANSGNTAVELYDGGSMEESLDAAEESLLRFNLVLKNGWVAFTDERAVEAKEWREACHEVKANVAVRQDYESAEKLYNQAFVALRSEEYADAADLFEQSEALFLQAHDAAVEKRIRAEAALREAEERLAASEEKAQSAEELIEGGE
jgi:hypothetical protein